MCFTNKKFLKNKSKNGSHYIKCYLNFVERCIKCINP